jgi:hypothetical protein
MQLWMAVDKHTNTVLSVVASLRLRQYPNFKVCDLRITTGEQFERWYHYMDIICEWAKSNGCKQRWKYLQDQDGNEFLNQKDLKKHTYKLRNSYEY